MLAAVLGAMFLSNSAFVVPHAGAVIGNVTKTIVLVGDSVGNVKLGYDNTIPVTVEEMLHHVKAVRRGETAMLARYEGNYAATSMIIMGDRAGFVWRTVPEFNYIDGLVYAVGHHRNGIPGFEQ